MTSRKTEFGRLIRRLASFYPNVKPDDYLYYLDLKEQMFGMK